MRKLLPFSSPLLIALYPVLNLAAANLDEVSASAVIRPLIASILLMITVLTSMKLLTRDWGKAALITSGVLIIFFSYGHIYHAVRIMDFRRFVIGRHQYLSAIGMVVLATWSWAVYRGLGNIARWNSIFSVVSGAALLLTIVTIVGHEVASYPILPESELGQTLDNASSVAFVGGERDIYYIVLDGYGREDVLREIYDFDNSPFIEFLKDRGFYVAEKSRSNYIITRLSIASSLNMRYMDDLAEILGEDSANQRPLIGRIHQNFVMDALSSEGYELVAFNTGFNATSVEDVDIYLAAEDNPYFRGAVPMTWQLNPFEGLLLETTIATGLFDLIERFRGKYFESVVEPLYQVQRERILYTLEVLAEIPAMDGAQFVFAHIVAPHPPFVFGPNGEERNPRAAFTWADGSDFLQEVGTRDEYISGYRGQLTYLNQILVSVISEILENSEPSPIIVLQADHGPGAYLNWQSISDSDLDERTSILNAYYFPDVETAALYSSISPVNTFRLVLSSYFGGNYPLLTDRVYLSSIKRPYDFILVD